MASSTVGFPVPDHIGRCRGDLYAGSSGPGPQAPRAAPVRVRRCHGAADERGITRRREPGRHRRIVPVISHHWPLFGLRLTTPRLELRLPRLDDLATLADLAAEGVHDPEVQPFLVPWTDTTPAERARSTVQYHWNTWAGWQPRNWSLGLVTVLDGDVVGTQELDAREFATLREVVTGSWLGTAHQGRGLGTEMRAAVLHLAFAGLGVNTTWYDSALGLAMLLGRFVPVVLVLGLAGSLAAQKPVPASAGTLQTHRPLFVAMLVGVTVILVALTFLPALALGPLAEGVR